MRRLPTVLLPLCLGACTGPGATDTAEGPPLPTPLATPGDLVEIPAGPFAMGCDLAIHPECTPDESPVHTVELSAFRIEVTEVTVAQWGACMDAFACPELVGIADPADFPVVAVPLEAAVGYCTWQGRRLPTEAEWERAARGADGGLYPWGDEVPDCDRAASRRCDGGMTPVATHPSGISPEGIYDMAGNAWEWVSDWYDPLFYGASPSQDPEMIGGGLRIVRGADGWADPSVLRATNREMAIPDAVSQTVGFRCVEGG
ncbi:MAG: SUMF1/EgtB/PvdO family nonheme iron enzyme [Pseudomonadota bacterium]|nr:SUMF1/EgtB/PvdO family nonheme iron enzyme [Pseudomonadota bacterium]